MQEILELQLTFRADAYPFSARALRKFGSAHSRSDYLKSVLEAHFRAIEEVEDGTRHERRHISLPRESAQETQPATDLEAADVARTFSSYF